MSSMMDVSETENTLRYYLLRKSVISSGKLMLFLLFSFKRYSTLLSFQL